jgi:4-alpha-glucanotransferase
MLVLVSKHLFFSSFQDGGDNMKRRASGILLHLISLPSPHGIGDMGPWAYRFVDFLTQTRQSYWQILPLNPTPAYSNSPYQGSSAFAGNPLFISLELLVQEGLLEESEAKAAPDLPAVIVDYASVRSCKEAPLRLAYERFKQKTDRRGYEEFCQSQLHWLDDYALFVALKSRFQGKLWSDWPEELRDRHPEALRSVRQDLLEDFEMERFLQFLFFKQWTALKDYCLRKGIQLIGDIPMYVHYDSADVWAHREIFDLDECGRPCVLSGVPPDYFSENGQLWGNPVYRWDVLRERGYDWWLQRMEHNLTMTDVVRVDHFRGLVAYWVVPATETTAVKGEWIEVPTLDFFRHLLKRFPYLPIIAEDLGTITPDVREIIHLFDLPGMKVLLFAFGDDLATNPYVPHNVVRNSVIYTGTHDNNTVRGWFEEEAEPGVKERLFAYLGRKISVDEVHWDLTRLAMMSVANLAIIPMQDILGLGEEARMNRPGGSRGNWEWRFLPEELTAETAEKLQEMTITYGRA